MKKDIEILESFIKQLEEFEDEEELKQAIENQINRVKELENKNKVDEEALEEYKGLNKELANRVKELEDLLEEKTIRVGFENQDNYISKDKIKEIIKELDKRVTEPIKTNWFARLTIGEALSFKHFLEQELLEQEDK